MKRTLSCLSIYMICSITLFPIGAFSMESKTFEEFIPYSLGMRGIAWNSDGSIAVICSDEGYLYFYYETASTRYSLYGTLGDPLIDTAWKPDSDYAIAVGRNGRIIEYEHNKNSIVELDTNIRYDFTGVSWRPDGKYALLLGERRSLYNNTRAILMFNESSKEEPVLLYQETSQYSRTFRDIAWKPFFDSETDEYKGYAVIVGDGIILRYNRMNFSTIHDAKGISFNAIAWKPDGSYALIGDSLGNLYTYDGKNFTSAISDRLYFNIKSISWKPDGSYALIAGEDGKIMKYFDSGLVLEMDYEKNECFNAIAWKPDGSYALLSTNRGTIVKYTPLALNPILSIEGSNPFKTGEKIVFHAAFSPYSDNIPSKYLFDFGDGFVSGWIDNTTSTHVFKKEGVYTVRLKLKDASGNESEWSDPIQIIVIDDKFLLTTLNIIFLTIIFLLLVLVTKYKRELDKK